MKIIETYYDKKIAKLKAAECACYISLPALLIILEAVLMKVF